MRVVNTKDSADKKEKKGKKKENASLNPTVLDRKVFFSQQLVSAQFIFALKMGGWKCFATELEEQAKARLEQANPSMHIVEAS